MPNQNSHALSKSKRIIMLLIAILLIAQGLVMFNWGLRPTSKMYGAPSSGDSPFSKPVNNVTEDILIAFVFICSFGVVAAVIIIQAKIGMHPFKKFKKKKREEEKSDDISENGNDGMTE